MPELDADGVTAFIASVWPGALGAFYSIPPEAEPGAP